MPTWDITDRKTPEELKKLPKPTNSNLGKLFDGIDRVIFKEGGVYNGKALSDNIVLTISQQDDVQRFKNLLEIDETKTGFYCMCSGDYAIELYSDQRLKTTIGFHHGISIRYHQWNGDAQLAKSDELLEFLKEQGLAKPLQGRLESKKKMETDIATQKKWLDIAPRCFAQHWTQIKSFDEDYFPLLIDELNAEIPDRKKQIIVLLETYGTTEYFWTGYPSYEALPNKILQTFDTKEIIEAYVNSDRNDKIRKGLGRFLCSFEFKKTRKKHLKFITEEVMNDLENCFDNLGEKRGISEIDSLKKEILF